MQLNKRLDTFELKLRQLASKFERQQSEKEALTKENRSLKQELDRQHGVVSSLKEKLEKVAGGDADPNTGIATSSVETSSVTPQKETLATRAQIEACIRELDACIEWLEKN